MSAARQRYFGRLDPEAQRAAIRAAQAEGMSLSEYLNTLILSDSDEADILSEEEKAKMAKARPTSSDDHQMSDIAAILDRLTRRMEQTDRRGISTVSDMASEDTGELYAVMDSVRRTQLQLNERMERVEASSQNASQREMMQQMQDALAQLTHKIQKQELNADQAQRVSETLNAHIAMVEKRINELNSRLAEQRPSDHIETDMKRKLAQMDARMETHADQMVADFARKMDAASADMRGEIEDAKSSMKAIQRHIKSSDEAHADALEELTGDLRGYDERVQVLEMGLTQFKPDMVASLIEQKLAEMSHQVEASLSEAHEQMTLGLAQTANRLKSENQRDSEAVLHEAGDKIRLLEEGQQRLSEMMESEMASLSSEIDAKLADYNPSEKQNDLIEAKLQEMQASLDMRFDDMMEREARLADKLGEETGKLAQAFEERISHSEKERDDAIEQVSDQVVRFAHTIKQSQESASKALADQMASMEKRQGDGLENSVDKLSSRVETLDKHTQKQLAPLQSAMKSLAKRVEDIERAASPFDTPVAPPFPQFDDSDVGAGELSIPSANDFSDRSVGATYEEISPPQIAANHGGYNDGFAADFAEDADYMTRARMAATTSGETATQLSQKKKKGYGRVLVASVSVAVIAYMVGTMFFNSGRAPETDTSVTTGVAPYDADAVGGAYTRPIPEAAADVRYDPVTGRPIPDVSPTLDYDPQTGRPIPQIGAAVRYDPQTGLPIPDVEPGVNYTVPPQRDTSSPAMQDIAPAPVARPPVAGAEMAAPPPASGMSYNTNIPRVKPEPPVALATIPALEPPGTARDPLPTDPLDIAAAPIVPPSSATSPSGATPSLNTPTTTLKQAAAEGNSIAQYEFAIQKISEGDAQMGASLMRKSALQGLPVAQYHLGKLYEQGAGVPRDFNEARVWTEKAAKGGNVKAMHDLAVAYAEGEGALQSYESAAEWFRKAASYGVGDSQFNLAILYEAGLGVSRDLDESLYWLEVAAKSGDADAAQMADELRANIAPDKVAEIADRVGSFNPRPSLGLANGEFPPMPWG